MRSCGLHVARFGWHGLLLLVAPLLRLLMVVFWVRLRGRAVGPRLVRDLLTRLLLWSLGRWLPLHLVRPRFRVLTLSTRWMARPRPRILYCDLHMVDRLDRVRPCRRRKTGVYLVRFSACVVPAMAMLLFAFLFKCLDRRRLLLGALLNPLLLRKCVVLVLVFYAFKFVLCARSSLIGLLMLLARLLCRFLQVQLLVLGTGILFPRALERW